MDHEAQMGLDFDSLDVAILVVGDKSNIPSIVDLAKAFDIRVGIAFEEHSVCWSDKRDEEDALNEKLLALAQHEVSIFCHRSGSVTEQDRSLEERVVQWITKT